MPEICPRYPLNTSEIPMRCLRYPCNMPEIWLRNAAGFRFRTFFVQFCTFFSGKFCCPNPHLFIVQTRTFSVQCGTFLHIHLLPNSTLIFAQCCTLYVKIIESRTFFIEEGHFCLAFAGGWSACVCLESGLVGFGPKPNRPRLGIPQACFSDGAPPLANAPLAPASSAT